MRKNREKQPLLCRIPTAVLFVIGIRQFAFWLFASLPKSFNAFEYGKNRFESKGY